MTKAYVYFRWAKDIYTSEVEFLPYSMLNAGVEEGS